MTDEELAEESLISYRKDPKWAGKIFMQDENTCYKDGFLAGLKAGRPQWHKVADGDLPKKTDEYLVYKISGYGSKSIELIQYNSSRQFWCVDCQNEIIAWCEIPTFDKE